MDPTHSEESQILSDMLKVGPTPPTNTPAPQDAVPQPPISPVPPPDDGPHLKQIRTYEGDVAEAIKKQNESIISIQRKEEKKKEALKTLAPSVEAKESHTSALKPLILSLLTIIFIAVGGYGAYYAWKSYSMRVVVPQVVIPANQFISADSVTKVDASTLGRQGLLAVVDTERNKPRDVTSLEQLEMTRQAASTTELLTTADFLTRLDTHAPSALVRAFDPLFMFGVYGSNPAHTVMLIKIDSFQNAFPGMLDWEGRMVEDILPLFASSDELNSVPSVSLFADKTINNVDVRILKDTNGNTVLLYGFVGTGMLVITDNEESFRTISGRLQSQELTR